jgi:ABC-type nitrate/sulfonate/bicarbonate transport system substrate-binding protein
MRKSTRSGLVPKTSLLSAMFALSAMTFCVPVNANAADIKLGSSAIGRPPIFSNTFVDVGEDMGYWKKVGLDMSFRWFQRGTDTAKAVITGDVQVGYTATPVAVNLIAAGAPLVIVAGMPNQDWIIGSDLPNVKECKDLKGQTVAADGINNARWLFLKSEVESCGLKLTEMTPIDLANAPLVKAGIAGQVHVSVFHVDELAQIEFKTGKKWHLIPVPAAIKAGLHYGSVLASKKAIADDREGVVRFLEGWIMTQKLMSSTKPADQQKFAEIAAKASQIDVKVAEGAIKTFQSIHYWVNNDGLDEKQMMGQASEMVKDGLLKPEAKPSYDKLVDKSLYAEAMKRVEKMGGMSK